VAFLFSVTSLGGLKIGGYGAPPLLFIGSLALLCLATVSGPDFRVHFPAEQASRERQDAETRFNQSAEPLDALEVDLQRLNEYYVINQSQARASFRWAVVALLAGFATIIAGIWMFYVRRLPQPDLFMASLSTAAGIVTDLVAGLFLLLHHKTQDRALVYYQQLAQVQRIAMAIRLAHAHGDGENRRVALDKVIDYLLKVERAVAV
jgi:hypothetical protein